MVSVACRKIAPLGIEEAGLYLAKGAFGNSGKVLRAFSFFSFLFSACGFAFLLMLCAICVCADGGGSVFLYLFLFFVKDGSRKQTGAKSGYFNLASSFLFPFFLLLFSFLKVPYGDAYY